MKKKQVHQHKTKMKESFGDRMVGVICYIIFGLCALVCVYPFYYIFINTISANDLSARGVILFWPRGIHFQNYVSALKIDGLFQAAKISLGRTVIGTFCTVGASAFLGYMFTQEDMWHKKFWYRILVATMYFNAGIIPWFLTMKNMMSLWLNVLLVMQSLTKRASFFLYIVVKPKCRLFIDVPRHSSTMIVTLRFLYRRIVLI